MSKKNTKEPLLRKILRKLNTDFKLIVLKRHNFEETLSINLTPLRAIVLFLILIILTISLTFCVLSLTFLKSYIPGCIDQSIRKDLVNYLIKVDSLDKSMHANEIFLSSINKVIDGKNDSKQDDKVKAVNDSTFQSTRNNAINSLNQALSSEESDLRKFIEKKEGGAVKQSYTRRKQTSISDYEFYSPLKGKILETYSLANNKLWIGVSGATTSNIHAILDGIIISIQEDPKFTSYTIIIQHDNNIISIYKNCKKVLKKVGNYVNTGDIIANGLDFNASNKSYILKFQLWYNGSSVNPSDFIKFN